MKSFQFHITSDQESGLFFARMRSGSRNTEIKIFDLCGKMIKQLQCESPLDEYSVLLDLRSEEDGTYVVTASDHSQAITHRVNKYSQTA